MILKLSEDEKLTLYLYQKLVNKDIIVKDITINYKINLNG